MGQTPLGYNSVAPGNILSPQQLDAFGALYASGTGNQSALDLTAGTHVLKASPGRLGKVIIGTASTTAVILYDNATGTGLTVAQQIYTTPATSVVGIYVFDWPCLVGLTIVVGTGGVVNVSFS